MDEINEILTIEEVAKLLHISRQHTYKLLYREIDPLPSIRLSEMTVRIMRDQFYEWLDKQRNTETKINN
jgi:excisionase family DNA binding protein